MDAEAEAVLSALDTLAARSPDDAGDAVWLADFRARTSLMGAFGVQPQPVEAVRHVSVPGPSGALLVRLYRPRPGRLPLLVHSHGGGGVAGTLDGYDAAMRALATATGWLVAAPDYRLAPEARYPAQQEDVVAAVHGLRAIAATIGADPDRIALSGDSLGGTLAFAAASLCRSRGGPTLVGQVLLYPNADFRKDAPWPSRRSQDGKIIDAVALERQIQLYFAKEADRHDPLASMVLAEDLKGLAPTLVITCEEDPLRDEGEAFAARLAGQGGVHVRLSGQIHGLLQMGGAVTAAQALLDVTADWLNGLA